jgi:hypothetical protein
MFGMYLDEKGNLIEKTPITNPYDYDGFVIWDTNTSPTDTVYSDRLFQWDAKKHDELCEKHFGNCGQYWNKREPKKIESFLSDYFDRKIKLCRVMQYCNQATGYPCWRFDYRVEAA